MNWLHFLLCFGFTTSFDIGHTDDKLIFTQIVSNFVRFDDFHLKFNSKYFCIQIFRHGNRTILKTFANDVFKDRINWPDGFSQLTNVSICLLSILIGQIN